MMQSDVYIHALLDSPVDLTNAVRLHSADEIVPYKEVNGQQLMLGFFWPKSRQGLHPAIILTHGGGWQAKKIFADQTTWAGDYLGFLARYLANLGYVCVSVDYRLAKDLAQPDGFQLINLYDECLDAANYIISNSRGYGIDRNRVIVLGESAGGQLAGALATFPRARHLNLCGAILVNPIMDFVNDLFWQTYVPKESVHPALRNLSFPQRCVYLSPLWQINHETCPIILLHGMDDSVVSPDHSIRTYESMKTVGRPCQLHLFEKTSHAFLLTEFKDCPFACRSGVALISASAHELVQNGV